MPNALSMIPAWQTRLQRVLMSWQGTPWVAGQQCRGKGVDCVRFVVAVLDELHGAALPPVQRLPQDAALHDRAGMMAVAHGIRQRYPHEVIEPRAERIEPGDVVVFRVGAQSGPGHVAIAGSEGDRELWHACRGTGVARTSAAASSGILWIWRPTRKESW
jgi:cell wall-associated NlpC family hydrolase